MRQFISTLVVEYVYCLFSDQCSLPDMLRYIPPGVFLTALPASALVNNWPFAPLRFSDDGTFQIGIFEDLHFGESMDAKHCLESPK